jgi:hypothetical protein
LTPAPPGTNLKISPAPAPGKPRERAGIQEIIRPRRLAMAKLVAQRARAVAYDPQYFLQMAEEYDDDRLEQLN